ncbi:MAG: hypothetical protein GF364_11190 [Candidatus Lokiarchaeota archaeon]|nr:hypothetical protein [Candidatus Lokiarchaeota archaeon]
MSKNNKNKDNSCKNEENINSETNSNKSGENLPINGDYTNETWEKKEEEKENGSQMQDSRKEETDYICLVNNYPLGSGIDRVSRIEKLITESIADVTLKNVHYSQFHKEYIENAIGIILTGSVFNVSSFYYDEGLRGQFKPQFDFLLNVKDIPILGICFGLHLIAYSYGAQICRMRNPNWGENIIKIQLVESDDLIDDKEIPVNIFHRDFVPINDLKVRENFEIISQTTIDRYKIVEYMRHKNKPIYAVQFHPETHEKDCFKTTKFDRELANKTRLVGEKIIDHFIWHCVYYKNKLKN